jgi:hypothetical protein
MYEPSLELSEKMVRDRFPGALAVAVCPTIHCDCYGFALFLDRGASEGSWAVKGLSFAAAVKPFAAMDRRIVVLRGADESEDFTEILGEAVLGRSGGTVVAQFQEGDAAAEAFSLLANAGKNVTIFSDHAMSTVQKWARDGLEMDDAASSIRVWNLPAEVGNQEIKERFGQFGTVKFSAVFGCGQTKDGKGKAVVTFGTSEERDSAIKGTYEGQWSGIQLKPLTRS